MGWDERQRAMLAEMGIRLWPQPGAHVAGRRPSGLPCEPAAGEPGGAREQRAGEAARPSGAFAPAVPVPVVAPRVAPTGDIDAMDWSALRAAVAGCTACGLCRGRMQTVFGVGHERAQWMVVGEAPGEQEDRRGEPFVGKAGQLLDNMLAALGLTRDAQASAGDPARQVYIANVLKCRPPMNRNPQPDEVARCEPFLQRQVALVQPRLILAMGRFAVQSLLKTDLAIGKLRGRVHHYQGVPTIVTYHPAYLLRQPADKARAWEDLCLAREVLAGGAPPLA